MYNLGSLAKLSLPFVLALCIIAGSLTVAYGLYSTENVVFIEKYALRLVVILTTTFLALESLRYVLRTSYAFSTCVLGLFILTITNNLGSFFAVAFYGVASLALGRFVIYRIVGLKSATDLTLALLLGTACLGTLIGWMARFPINYPMTYSLVFLVPILTQHRFLTDAASHCWQTNVVGTDFNVVKSGIAVLVTFYLYIALLPEQGFDALVTHLFVAHHVSFFNEWGFDPGLYNWALAPRLPGWNYAAVYMSGGETAVRLLNLLFHLILIVMAGKMVHWCGGKPKNEWITALLFLTTPVTFLEISNTFTEGAWTAYVIGAVFVLFRYLSRESSVSVSLKLIGLFCGFAVASKPVTLVLLPFIFLLMLFRAKDVFNFANLGSIIAGLSFFILVSFTPYLSAHLISGNPVLPFFNAFFQSEFYPPVNFDNPLFKAGVRWDLFYNFTFSSGNYLEGKPGSPGFHWLILFPAAFIFLTFEKARRPLLLFFVCAGFLVITFQSQSYLRYIYPSFLLGSCLIGLLASFRPQKTYLNWVITSSFIGTLGLNTLFLTSATFSHNDFVISPLISAKARTEYEATRAPLKKMINVANELNAASLPVAFLTAPLAAGLNADAVFPNWYNFKFQLDLMNAESPLDVTKAFKLRRIQFVILDDNWSSPAARSLVEEVSTEITRIGPLRLMESQQSYSIELLKNSEFTSDAAWNFHNGSTRDKIKNAAIVSVSKNATQEVQVDGGRHYRNTVSAQCFQEQTQGRVQINWHDANRNFIKADIKVFDCTEFVSAHIMDVVSPNDAEHAIVYASGHTEAPLIVRTNSLKW